MEYKGLHLICAQCGCYGHLFKDCPIKKMVVPVAEGGFDAQNQPLKVGEKFGEGVNGGPQNPDVSDKDQISEILHGEWLNVTRKKWPNKPMMGAKTKETFIQESGNRFHALYSNISREEFLHDVLKDGPSKPDGKPNQSKCKSYKKRARKDPGKEIPSGPSNNKQGRLHLTRLGIWGVLGVMVIVRAA